VAFRLLAGSFPLASGVFLATRVALLDPYSIFYTGLVAFWP
jgi:hypothetical protein